jgi:diguanylate cyclase (GGDEF)-like protein
LLAELSDLTPREFGTSLEVGDVRLELEVSVEPLEAGPFNPGEALLVTIRGGGAEPAPSPEARLERRESLWNLVVRRGFSAADQIRAILREACAGLDLESALLGRVEGIDLRVEYAVDAPDVTAGETIPLERAAALDALRRAGTFAVLDAGDDPRFLALAVPAKSFISVAFRVGDEQWTLSYSSTRPRAAAFEDDDWSYVDFTVEALARALERLQNDARIQKLAYTDELTSVPNRTALLERLDETLAESARLDLRAGLLFVDVDGFGTVNDTIGHQAGDAVLAEVAARLRSTLRREEFIGRYGGDEFAIVMEGVKTRAQIESIAQRIAAVLTAPFQVEEHRFSLSASLGVALYPDDATTREELIAAADQAMYAAKQDGGSRIRFHDGAWISNANEGPGSGLGTVGEVRESYLMLYQPILNGGRVAGAEALIRRVHPQHGLLAPEHGWSIARDEPERRKLDQWVLREALAQARALGAAGFELSIDVNLAAYDPRDIEDLFADPYLAAGLPRIRIEIDAEQFADPSADFETFLERCKTSGLGLVIDRFDGAFAELRSLSHLPVQAVKLDRGLVDTMLADPAARASIEGSLVVTGMLGWRMIAKGVETLSQLELLVSLGVDGVQGFYIGHPMTAIDFGKWLRNYGPPRASV